MLIKTITCHDVYNAGASLQAYALMKYLSDLGHSVEIIDYKPDYLTGHFDLLKVNNPRYRGSPVLSFVYILVHMPRKVSRMGSKRAFDSFRRQYLHLTRETYESNEELSLNLPTADVFITGSDQVWNTSFHNGRDPAFYLDFVKNDSVKASYAASFSTDSIHDQYIDVLKSWISKLNFVSVRETSGLQILENIGFQKGVQVLDPVFLLDKQSWYGMMTQTESGRNSVFLYDVDKSQLASDIAKKFASERKLQICSVFKSHCTNKKIRVMGPLEFLCYIKNAEFVISNSFHATAFAIIFEKEFVVINRKEKINARMRDLLALFGLSDRLVNDVKDIEKLKPIDFEELRKKVVDRTRFSKEYLNEVLSRKGGAR